MYSLGPCFGLGLTTHRPWINTRKKDSLLKLTTHKPKPWISKREKDSLRLSS